MVGARALAVFKFSLGNSGAEGDIPKSWCLGLVGLTALEVAQESKLAHPLGISINCLVGLAPVNGKPHATPEFFEYDFILHRQLLTKFNEVFT